MFDDFYIWCITSIPTKTLYPSLFVTAIILIITLLLYKNKYKGVLGVLITEYLFLVLSSTIFCRSIMPESRLELTPFWTYHAAIIDRMPGVSVWDIVLNVVLFIPLGLLVKLLNPMLKLWQVTLIAFFCSVFIETNQFVFEKGIAQFDDVMHNTVGAMIGWGIAWIGVQGLKKFKSSKGLVI